MHDTNFTKLFSATGAFKYRGNFFHSFHTAFTLTDLYLGILLTTLYESHEAQRYFRLSGLAGAPSLANSEWHELHSRRSGLKRFLVVSKL